MGTLVAVQAADGVVLAADTRTVEDGTVTSDRGRQLFAFDDAVTGAVGEPGAVDEFGRRMRAELQQVDVEVGVDLDPTRLGRIAADVAADVDVDAFVAARDDQGEAAVLRVGSDGSTVPVDRAALGSGAGVALGHLEGADADPELAAAVELARESVRVARERDPETGGDVEVAALEDRE